MTTLKPSSLFIVATFETLMLDAIAYRVLIVADAAIMTVEYKRLSQIVAESVNNLSWRMRSLHNPIRIGIHKLFIISQSKEKLEVGGILPNSTAIFYHGTQ